MREVCSHADVRTFWSKKFEFFENYGVFIRTKGLSQGGNFSDKREDSIYRDFVRTSFMDDPLHYFFNATIYAIFLHEIFKWLSDESLLTVVAKLI